MPATPSASAERTTPRGACRAGAVQVLSQSLHDAILISSAIEFPLRAVLEAVTANAMPDDASARTVLLMRRGSYWNSEVLARRKTRALVA